MTQYGFFNQTGTAMLVCIVHSWNYDTNSRQAVAHFMITDDLKKTNMQVNKFKEDLVKYYDDLLFAWVQQHLSLLSIFSDNCGYQFKSRFSSFPFLNTTRCVKKMYTHIIFMHWLSGTSLHGWVILSKVTHINFALSYITFQLLSMARGLQTLRLVCCSVSHCLYSLRT